MTGETWLTWNQLLGSWLLTVTLIGMVACEAIGPSPPGSEPYPDEKSGERSDALTYSELSECDPGDLRSSGAVELGHPLRLASWNIQAGRSAPLDDIEGELAAMQADVIALQEVDVRVRRTGFVNQPLALATALGFHYAFAASIKWDGGDYGLALLSRLPLSRVQRHRLNSTGASEPRIVLDVTLCVAGRSLRVFNHHADISRAARQNGLAELAEMVKPELGRGVVVLGDFNEGPEAPGVVGLLESGLNDVFAERGGNTAASGRIDYLLVDALLVDSTTDPQVWITSSSDHHALLVGLDGFGSGSAR